MKYCEQYDLSNGYIAPSIYVDHFAVERGFDVSGGGYFSEDAEEDEDYYFGKIFY